MTMYEIIDKKKNKKELSKEEIAFFVNGYTKGEIPDYQMSALLMAIVLNSMTDREIADMTLLMANSGDMLDLSFLGELSVDKHSTGGVGDKTTLIVAPIVAACGGKIAKMSGRGLGHTGGTVDKLESIKGFKIELSGDDFKNQAQNIGLAVIGQSGNMTPADKKIYALRDVTATVDSIPLIVSSIMSKKLAAGSKNIVLDVKFGSGAFMKDKESAEILAQKMVDIGKKCGRNMAALVTNMDVPLGSFIGNALEVKEALSVLKGETKGEILEVCLSLSASMLSLCLKIDIEKAYKMAQDAVLSGAALNKFYEWISAQGGEGIELEDVAFALDIKAEDSGYIYKMDTQKIGLASALLGAARKTKDDKIDYLAGIEILKKTGDYVKKGEKIAVLYTSHNKHFDEALKMYLSGIEIKDTAPNKEPLIFKTIH